MSRETELEDSIVVLIGERNDALDKLAAAQQREAGWRAFLDSAINELDPEMRRADIVRLREEGIRLRADLAASEPARPSMSKETAAEAYSALFGEPPSVTGTAGTEMPPNVGCPSMDDGE